MGKQTSSIPFSNSNEEEETPWHVLKQVLKHPREFRLVGAKEKHTFSFVNINRAICSPLHAWAGDKCLCSFFEAIVHKVWQHNLAHLTVTDFLRRSRQNWLNDPIFFPHQTSLLSWSTASRHQSSDRAQLMTSTKKLSHSVCAFRQRFFLWKPVNPGA